MTLMIILTIAGACIFAEFAGYFIHMLLHSNKVEFLSRNHMIHHLKIYGPKMHMRPSEKYMASVKGRASFGNIGMEWILPIGILMGSIAVTFWLLQIRILFSALFLGVALTWAFLMFNYVHDRLHMKGFWMERNRFFKARFLKARRMHDLHHMDLSDDGRMTKNFGICFFVFDWIFGSLERSKVPFNKVGFEAAQQRYAYIYDDSGELK